MGIELVKRVFTEPGNSLDKQKVVQRRGSLEVEPEQCVLVGGRLQGVKSRWAAAELRERGQQDRGR